MKSYGFGGIVQSMNHDPTVHQYVVVKMFRYIFYWMIFTFSYLQLDNISLLSLSCLHSNPSEEVEKTSNCRGLTSKLLSLGVEQRKTNT